MAAPSGLLAPDLPNSWDDLAARRLTSDTLRRWGYFRAGFNGGAVQVAPYFDQEGNPLWQKLRLPGKEFVVLKADPGAGGLSKAQLFGRHVFGDKYDRQVIICEGEIDAMTVAQVVDHKVAVVSPPTGAQGAMAALKANYLWVDRFQDIVLFLDDDEPGRTAAEECAKLFAVGKVRIAKAPGFKDPSEAMKADRPGDIKAAIWSAVKWRPRGIVNAKDIGDTIRRPQEDELSHAYPPAMAKLQEMTGGMWPGEVVYHVAGTGVGKTAVQREIQHHLLTQGVKIAVLSFEDTLRDMQFGLMSIAASERLHLVPLPGRSDVAACEAYDQRMLRVHAQVFGGGLVELFDPETAEWTMEAILGYVRYCAKALDCKVIFIDPLSFVAAGIELSADERRVLDKIAKDVAQMAKELGIHLQISHHLKRTVGIPHEEGAPTSLNELRSSGALANFATGVIGWERNSQAEGEAWRVTRSRILKPIRRTGKSGLADVLYYGEDGRLIPSPLPFPPIGKPEGADEGGPSRQGFGPVDQTDY